MYSNEDSMAMLSLMYTLLPVALVLIVLFIVSFWKLHEKAGYPGWATLIPFYNFYIYLKIGGKSGWWLLLAMIPYIGIIWQIGAVNSFTRAFGKSVSWTIGCIFLPFIFYPIMAFSKNIYYLGNSNSILHQEHDPNVLDSFNN